MPPDTLPTPTPTPTPTAGPTPTPTPTPTPSPTPGPAPLPPNLSVSIPNIPSNAYQILCGLADAIDTANGKFQTSSGHLSTIMGQTGGAMNDVITTSSGKATDALASTWHYTQTDLNGAHEPLVTITSNGYLGGNSLRSTLEENQGTFQAGMAAIENIHVLQSACLAHPPTEQVVEGWIQQINNLTAALGNINLILDAMAIAIRGLNSGFAKACATGFTPGGPLPTFTKSDFTGTGGGNLPEDDGYTQLRQYLQNAGLGQRKIANILQALQAAGMSEADVARFLQALQDSGADSQKIIDFFSNPNQVARVPEIWSLYQKVQGVPNANRILYYIMRGAPTSAASTSTTTVDGALYQLKWLDQWVTDHPDGPYISDIETPIGDGQGPDVTLSDGTIVDLKSYQWGRSYPQDQPAVDSIIKQVQGYRQAYGQNVKITYVFDTSKGEMPKGILEQLQNLGITIEFWP